MVFLIRSVAQRVRPAGAAVVVSWGWAVGERASRSSVQKFSAHEKSGQCRVDLPQGAATTLGLGLGPHKGNRTAMLTRRTLFAIGSGAVTVALVAPPAWARRRVWPAQARAAVSLTYDDGLDSQLDHAIPALNARGLKATFFLTEQNMEARLAEWRAVAAEGHEIGDHTVDHPCDLRGYSAARFAQEEIDGSERFLDSNFGIDPDRAYAFPCGVIDLGRGPQIKKQLRYISVLRHTFVAARAADGDPNDPRRAGRDRYVLQAIAPTYDRDDPRLATDYLRKAMRRGFWAILIFHDVVPKRIGKGDTSIASHDLILDWIKDQPIWCAPMRSVLRALKVETT
jgi:peptidoglycan/xylan/chitin deacetylase (PgdA/CDA1 family)